MQDEQVNFDVTQESNVKRIHTPILVESLKPHLRNAKKQQAQIRSSVESTYPEAGVGNSLNDSVFGSEEFGFGDGQTFTENRVAWIDVPAKMTVEQVQERINVFPHATIYRVLSLTPILTDEQERAMASGISEYTDADAVIQKCNMEYYKTMQMVPTPETASLPREQRQPLLYKGYVQYRITPFNKDGQADIDHRETQLKAHREKAEFKMNEPVTDTVNTPKANFAKGF